MKLEISCYPNREICNWSKIVHGSTSDITIFRNNLNIHKRLSKKFVTALAVVDHGEGSQDHPNHHGILLDKGYIGIKDSIRLVFF